MQRRELLSQLCLIGHCLAYTLCYIYKWVLYVHRLHAIGGVEWSGVVCGLGVVFGVWCLVQLAACLKAVYCEVQHAEKLLTK